MPSSHEIPSSMLAWQMFGAGFEKFGIDGRPSTLSMPEISDDELLVRIDAIGLCFSDVKLIRAGEEHPRVRVDDLSNHPLIPGHEAVMTVVKVGSGLASQFQPGGRYIIQADIYYKGENWAYGYAIDGGMAQYSVINEKVLKGDEGCYLLPLADSIPSALAALLEPWTCVLASYLIQHRSLPKPSGKVLIAFDKEAPADGWTAGRLLEDAKPSAIHLLNVSSAFESEIRRSFPRASIETLSEAPSAGAYDDLFLCSIKDKSLGETLCKLCSVNACVSFIGEYQSEDWLLDVGSIHYKGWFCQGAQSRNLSDSYGRNVRSRLKKGGLCWLPGGAGAMGQMHTQLAVESPDGPSKILVSDMDDTRIGHVRRLLSGKAKDRGVELKFINPNNFKSPSDFETEISAFAPDGFDDIIMLVPSPAVASSTAKRLKSDGLMNIFAGIPAGKEAPLDIKGISSGGHRFIGSSGSRTEDLRQTLKLVESGRLNPASALAAVGGMMSLKDGLIAVADAKFPGKTVILPNCPDMPLTPVDKLGSLVPAIKVSFSADGFYTNDTESAILKAFST